MTSKETKFRKRKVSYWLICGGKHSSGKEARAVINPGVEHYHRVRPYAVRCVNCAAMEKLT